MNETADQQRERLAALSVTCGNCRWWRHKADANGVSVGVCDNSNTIEQAIIHGLGMILRFVTDEELKNDLLQEIRPRYRSDFGCINHQPRQTGEPREEQE